MVPSMKDNGKETRLMELESFGMLMETFTREIGLMTKHMEGEHMCTLMEQNIQENGQMIYNMVTE